MNKPINDRVGDWLTFLRYVKEERLVDNIRPVYTLKTLIQEANGMDCFIKIGGFYFSRQTHRSYRLVITLLTNKDGIKPFYKPIDRDFDYVEGYYPVSYEDAWLYIKTSNLDPSYCFQYHSQPGAVFLPYYMGYLTTNKDKTTHVLFWELYKVISMLLSNILKV